MALIFQILEKTFLHMQISAKGSSPGVCVFIQFCDVANVAIIHNLI
jgi:hypothetical protein